jgi:carbonic anhydrase/acetyltransferase-like protein (isoleucine patch superfamily)
MSAVIMDDVIVEDDVIIGAGSLVPPGKRLESGYLYVGSPIEKKRKLNTGESAFLSQSAQNYVDLKDDYLLQVSPVS